MRVVFLQKTTDAQGGSKASLRNTFKALSEIPILELELCGEARGALSEFAQELGVPFHITPFPRWRNLGDRICFKRTMKRFSQTLGRADWIISNEMWWAPHAVQLAQACGARSAVIVRDEIADLKKAKQYCFSKLDRVVTVSEDLRAQLAEDASLYGRTETIYNIVERPPVFTEAADTIRTLCGSFPVVRKWLLTAGTICPRKDQILTVQTLAELVQRGHSDLGLLIAGGDDGGDYQSNLKQAIEARGLTNHVAFAGQINGIGAALEAAVAFVLTSHSEGLPRVLIESSLARVPSISTRVSGVYEVYGEHIARFVAETRSATDLADRIEPILNGLEQETTEALAMNMEQQFCPETHTKSWKQLLHYA